MKVSELIEELRKMSQDAEVKVGQLPPNSTPDNVRLSMVLKAAKVSANVVCAEELEDQVCLWRGAEEAVETWVAEYTTPDGHEISTARYSGQTYEEALTKLYEDEKPWYKGPSKEEFTLEDFLERLDDVQMALADHGGQIEVFEV